MILQYLAPVWVTAAPAVANHLWQSTLFAAIAALLVLVLRKDQARARYWLWLVASLKFLVPFALLVELGGVFTVPGFHAGRQGAGYFSIEQFSQPFVRPATAATATVVPSAATSSFTQWLPALLVAIWLVGFAIVLLTWCVRWRRMSKVLRGAIPLVDGKEVETLHRLESLAGVQKHIPVFLSRESFEPGIFGIFRPALVLPEGICQRLSEKHLEAILAHEVWHVRCRDNLTAAAHTLVQALFWFHPLVWWLGGRLVEERERACDEQVLKLGNPPQIYAESILKTCELCVESPLACASGVTGADLKKRVVRIMTERARHHLSIRKKLLLCVAGSLAIAVPVGLGLAHPRQTQMNALSSEPSLARTAKFEVASIKRIKQTGLKIGISIMDSPNDGRFYATGPTVRMLIRLAYGVQDSQIIGGPDWINSERFNIQAKADSATDAELKKLSPQQAKLVKEHMLQELLADRFKLKLHHETKRLPVYVLDVAKNGPKLEEAKDVADVLPAGYGGGRSHLAGPGGVPGDATVAPGVPHPRGGNRIAFGTPDGGLVTGRPPGTPGGDVMIRDNGGGPQMYFHDALLSSFVSILAQLLGRTVVDKTGLTGRYNFKLHWVSDMGRMMMSGPGPMPGGNGGPSTGTAPPPAPSGPSIFTALEEQLGLKLKSERGPVPVIVIDHISPPTPN